MVNTKKNVIYSAQYGNYDEIRQPETIYEDVDYILFTDREVDVPDPWKLIVIEPFTIDSIYSNRRMSRYCKAVPHLLMCGWENSIWIDMTHEVKVHPVEIVNTYMKNSDVCTFKHESRDCVFDEMNAVHHYQMDLSVNLKRQVNFYKSVKYPSNNGLFETSALIRKNNTKTHLMNCRWWEMMCRYSSRDQISFPFILWSLNMKIDILPGRAGKGHQRARVNNDVIPFIKGHIHEN